MGGDQANRGTPATPSERSRSVQSSQMDLQSSPPSQMLNAAFLSEIKQDNVQFNELIRSIADALSVEASIRPRVLSELLSQLRDELETHFALEEFYGYVDRSVLSNPSVSQQVDRLKNQHAELYTELTGLVEETERLVYHEVPTGRQLTDIVKGFFVFFEHFNAHEEKEMDLAMRLANEEIGTGD